MYIDKNNTTAASVATEMMVDLSTSDDCYAAGDLPNIVDEKTRSFVMVINGKNFTVIVQETE